MLSNTSKKFEDWLKKNCKNPIKVLDFIEKINLKIKNAEKDAVEAAYKNANQLTRNQAVDM